MKILKDTVYRCVDAEAQGKIKRTALIFTGLISLLAFVLTVWNIVILYFEFDFYSALAVFVFSSLGFLFIWKERFVFGGSLSGEYDTGPGPRVRVDYRLESLDVGLQKETKIVIILRKEGGEASLEVQDNGVGIPETAGEKGGGIGLMVIDALTNQLQGKSSIAGENGSSFRIVFPL